MIPSTGITIKAFESQWIDSVIDISETLANSCLQLTLAQCGAPAAVLLSLRLPYRLTCRPACSRAYSYSSHHLIGACLVCEPLSKGAFRILTPCWSGNDEWCDLITLASSMRVTQKTWQKSVLAPHSLYAVPFQLQLQHQHVGVAARGLLITDAEH